MTTKMHSKLAELVLTNNPEINPDEFAKWFDQIDDIEVSECIATFYRIYVCDRAVHSLEPLFDEICK